MTPGQNFIRVKILSDTGRPTNLEIEGQGPIVLAVDAVGCC